MPWTDLPTNFGNLIWMGLKKFRQYNNEDNTVSFEDVTEYSGSNTQMSAEQLNQMTDAINQMMDGDLFYTEAEVDAKLANKQNTLTFDDSATSGSANPVKSGGLYIQLSGKSDVGHIHDDRYYTETETDTLLSGKSDTSHNHDDRYYTETETDDLLDTKQDTLTFDTTPTASSTNPVTSGGIKTALDNKTDLIRTSASGDPVIITDGSPSPVVDLTVAIEPVQDLHGYDYPYPAGGGKNLLNCTQINTSSGTFAGNVSWVRNSDGSFTLNGTATSTDNLILKSMADYSFPSGNYIVSGCPVDGSANTYRIVLNKNNSESFGTDTGSGSVAVNLADGDVASVYIRVNSGVTISNKTFYPMVRNSTVLDSTYEPYENICPISGWTGAKIYHIKENLFTITATSTIINGVEYTVNPDGSIIANGTATSSAILDVGDINLKANTTYWLAGCPNDGGNDKYRIYYRNVTHTSTMDDGNGSSYTPTENETRTIRLVVYSGFTAQNLVFRPMICLASDSHSIYPISWQTEAGTVYGGSLDVTTGVLTVDRVNVKLLKSWDWKKSSNIGDFYISSTTVTDVLGGSRVNNKEILCSHAKFVTTSAEKNIGDCWNNSNYHFYIISTDNSLNDWKNYLDENDVYICYYLATPITYQLTPTEVTTLLGNNTISADTGAVDVTYRADTKLYIDKKIAESQRATRSLIAGIETEMVATKNYSIGDLLIVGDTLYKVTANIANGSAITVGTNITATTVAEELILLANA